MVLVTEGLEKAIYKEFLNLGYVRSEALTLLGGAGYGGSRAGTLQEVLTLLGGAGYGGSRAGYIQAALDFARWCWLRRVWIWLSSSSS